LGKKEMLERNKVKRCLTEREILATANHPFIVTLYYSFQSSDHLYFVMEYCAGGEFFRALQKQPHKCLPEDHARFYAAEVLLALEYLHMMGFIYRDLKPENILLHENGHIQLTDFDLSKQAAQTVHPSLIKTSLFSKTPKVVAVPEMTTNSFVGTEEYIAPEVIEGFGHTSAVDWWTFGILIYEMVYGSTPFKGENRKDTFKHILDGEHFLKLPDAPVLSADGKHILKRLLVGDPKKRLGGEHGAADIKEQKWFKNKINFALIRNEKPPLIPKLAHPLDTSNFRELSEKETDDLHDSSMSDSEIDPASPFKEFKSVNKEKNK